SSLGLEISERSARRIMDGEILVLEPLIEGLKDEQGKAAGQAKKKQRAKDIHKDQRGLKFSPEDLKEFVDDVAGAYSGLAKRYYLEEAVRPDLELGREEIRIRIPLNKLN
ncbi:MAG: ATP-binding protein, partial [Eggerthellaceae bacterium]|nr:ATP-binding protein [Eggerthellaceae bacterium]